MYYSESIPVPPLTIFMFIVAYIAGFLPMFAAYKRGSRKLMILSGICGLFTFFFIPPMVAALVVSRAMPQTLPPERRHRWIEAAFLAGTLILGLLLPSIGVWGQSINGYQLMSLTLSASDWSFIGIPFLLFLLAAIPYCICCFVVGDRALYAFRVIMLVLGALGLGWLVYVPSFLSTYASILKIGLILMVLAMVCAVVYAWVLTCRISESAAAYHGGSSGGMGTALSELLRRLFRGNHTPKTGNAPGGDTPARLTCARCGASVRREAAFCPQCGNKLSRESKCPQCGSPVKPGQRFCGRCGKAL